MGWVSLFEPNMLASLLGMPTGSEPVAILCLGHVKDFYPKPMLELENWANKLPLPELLMENYWTPSRE